jgi:hypothetical protein
LCAVLARLRQWWTALPSGVPQSEPLTDEREARRVLGAKVEQLRSLAYDELRRLKDSDNWRVAEDIDGPSGRSYQLETEVSWDDEAQRHLRVHVTLYEEGFASRRLTDDFIMAPDGTFVDE